MTIIPDQLSDHELIHLCLQGQMDQFSQLVERHQVGLHRFIWRLVQCEHEAQDLTQDSFLKAYRQLEAYQPQYAFSTWLYTIARNLCLDSMKKRNRFWFWGDSAPEQRDSRLGPESIVANEDERTWLWATAKKLKPEQYELLVMAYAENLSLSDIGTIIGYKENTVKQKVFRARQALQLLVKKTSLPNSFPSTTIKEGCHESR